MSVNVYESSSLYGEDSHVIQSTALRL